ncbi:hypothetical protein [Mesotoga sp. Brook.08.105.5.1]|uniref:hypothetical protein n=1 Tax=Mesotoga sp. Brook.08.105.5.1 TaxID=1421002 RepID=UPI00105631C4|nr:hypothetical protein [Mesotoga sp. Brook.08.105.5.1]
MKQVQHDGMRYSPNNLRQSFQSRILNFVFDLLLGLTKNEEQVLALERRMSFQTNGTDSIFIAVVSGWSGAKKEFYRVHQEANECQNRVRLLILCNAFYKSGIRAHYDVLEVTWKVAKDVCPDEIMDDNQRDALMIVIRMNRVRLQFSWHCETKNICYYSDTSDSVI